MRKPLIALVMIVTLAGGSAAQQPAPAIVVLQPDRVFDGERMKSGWIVGHSTIRP